MSKQGAVYVQNRQLKRAIKETTLALELANFDNAALSKEYQDAAVAMTEAREETSRALGTLAGTRSVVRNFKRSLESLSEGRKLLFEYASELEKGQRKLRQRLLTAHVSSLILGLSSLAFIIRPFTH